MRLTIQVPKSSPGGRGRASFEEKCSSMIDEGATDVAGCRSVRTQQDARCEVNYLGPVTAQEAAVLGPAATGKALMFRLHRLYYQ